MVAYIKRLIRNRGGNFGTLSAVTFPIIMLAAAIAVDGGSIYTQRRHLQGVVDIAALSAMANPNRAANIANATLGDNGFAGLFTLVAPAKPETTNKPEYIFTELGNYAANPTLDAANRFRPGLTPINAVRVRAQTNASRFFFEKMIGPTPMEAEAIAMIAQEASITIGSRLAKLDGGLANQLLSALLGTTVNLSVMDYDALLATDISILQFLDFLATDLKLEAGTYQDVLDTKINISTLARVAAKVPDLSLGVKAALSKLTATSQPGAPKIKLGALFDIGNASRGAFNSLLDGPVAEINMFDLVMAAAQVSNGSQQVALNLGAGLPPLAGVTVDLAIGEPPQSSSFYSFGPEGHTVRTAQTRLKIKAGIGEVHIPLILRAGVTIPLYLELASGETTIDSISCNAGVATVKTSTKPGLATLMVADVNPAEMKNFAKTPNYPPATLLNVLNLVEVTAFAKTTAGNILPTKHTFTQQEIDNHTKKKAKVQNPTQTLTRDLLKNLKLDVRVLIISLGLDGLLRAAITPLIDVATPIIDNLLNAVLNILGVSLGEVDVWVNGVNCGRPVLVN